MARRPLVARPSAGPAALGLATALVVGCASYRDGERVSIARELGIVTGPTCSAAAIVRRIGPRCERVHATVHPGPSLDPGAAAAVVDGDLCRSWNAGGPAPRWVALDFDAAAAVDTVLLVPRYGGPAAHVVEASDDGETFRAVFTFSGDLRGGQPYAVELPRPVRARWLRVRTTSSTQAVAWREIAPLRCGVEPTSGAEPAVDAAGATDTDTDTAE